VLTDKQTDRQNPQTDTTENNTTLATRVVITILRCMMIRLILYLYRVVHSIGLLTLSVNIESSWNGGAIESCWQACMIMHTMYANTEVYKLPDRTSYSFVSDASDTRL